jgi:hypothetical protein
MIATKAIGALCAILLLSACTQTQWVKSGTTSAQTDADTSACRRVAGQDGFITVYQNDYELADAESRFRDCMKGRGYADQGH